MAPSQYFLFLDFGGLSEETDGSIDTEGLVDTDGSWEGTAEGDFEGSLDTLGT